MSQQCSTLPQLFLPDLLIEVIVAVLIARRYVREDLLGITDADLRRLIEETEAELQLVKSSSIASMVVASRADDGNSVGVPSATLSSFSESNNDKDEKDRMRQKQKREATQEVIRRLIATRLGIEAKGQLQHKDSSEAVDMVTTADKVTQEVVERMLVVRFAQRAVLEDEVIHLDGDDYAASERESLPSFSSASSSSSVRFKGLITVAKQHVMKIKMMNEPASQSQTSPTAAAAAVVNLEDLLPFTLIGEEEASSFVTRDVDYSSNVDGNGTSPSAFSSILSPFTSFERKYTEISSGCTVTSSFLKEEEGSHASSPSSKSISLEEQIKIALKKCTTVYLPQMMMALANNNASSLPSSSSTSPSQTSGQVSSSLFDAIRKRIKEEETIRGDGRNIDDGSQCSSSSSFLNDIDDVIPYFSEFIEDVAKTLAFEETKKKEQKQRSSLFSVVASPSAIDEGSQQQLIPSLVEAYKQTAWWTELVKNHCSEKHESEEDKNNNGAAAAFLPITPQRLETLLAEAFKRHFTNQSARAALASRVAIIIDPIDGTNAFTQGDRYAPMTLVGIAIDGRPVAGVTNRILAEEKHKPTAAATTMKDADADDADKTAKKATKLEEADKTALVSVRGDDDSQNSPMLLAPTKSHEFMTLLSEEERAMQRLPAHPLSYCLVVDSKEKTPSVPSPSSPSPSPRPPIFFTFCVVDGERIDTVENRRVQRAQKEQYQQAKNVNGASLSSCANGDGLHFVATISSTTRESSLHGITSVLKPFIPLRDRAAGNKLLLVAKGFADTMAALPLTVHKWDTLAPHSFIRGSTAKSSIHDKDGESLDNKEGGVVDGGDLVDGLGRSLRYPAIVVTNVKKQCAENKTKIGGAVPEDDDGVFDRTELPTGVIACGNSFIREIIVKRLRNKREEGLSKVNER